MEEGKTDRGEMMKCTIQWTDENFWSVLRARSC